jgi:MFS family permease
VLLIGIGGLAISYLMWVFAGSFLVLMLARILGGLMSGNISTASAVIADVTPHQRRSRGMALIGVGIGTAFMFGPAVGGYGARFDLTAYWPWLEAYGINRYSVPALAAFTLTAINWLSIAIRLRETLPAGKAPSAVTWRALNLTALFRTEKYPGVTRANMTYFLFLIAFSGMEFSLTFLATDRLNYDEHDIPSMFVFIGVVLILMQGTYVRLMSGAIGPKRMSTHGLMLGVPGLVIVGSAHHTATLFLGLFVMAVASSQVRPCMSALVSLYTPISDQGRVLGVFRSLESLARALGPLLACALYWRLGSAMAYYVAAAVMLAPLLLIRALPAVGAAPVDARA